MPARRHFGSVRKLPSGRYQASYWHKAERHTAAHTFVTKGEALACLSSIETDVNRGAWIDPSGAEMTVDELANRWRESDPAKRTSTRTRDDLAIRLHIIPALGSKKLAQVTAPDIQRLVNDWATKRAPRTVRREYAVLRAMFAYAVGSDWLARSPCRRIKQPALRTVVRPQLLPEDVDAIATAVGSRYSTMVWCGALLGLRWGEVAGLRVGDLDLLGGTLRISQQRPAQGPAGPPKSKAGERPLSLPAALVTMLAAHLSACNLTGANESSLAFTAPDGTPLDYSNWRRRIWVRL